MRSTVKDAAMTTQTSESLLLDLVNSRLVFDDHVADELGDDRAAAAWLRGHGATGASAEVADARAAREALVGFLRGEASVDVLSRWVDVMRRRAEVSDHGLVWREEVPADRVIGARAVEAWAALQTPEGSRIRPCAASDCQHFLIDHSRANARRWHSMETCGNREKARRHYARTKQG